MALKSFVRSVRKRRGKRQEDLAAAVDVSRQTIIALERDGYTPSTELALRLARALGVAVEELFGLEEE
jgi:putative transcriptional regulator